MQSFRTFLFDKSVVNVPFLRAERKPQTLILQAFMLASLVGLIHIKRLQFLTGITPDSMIVFAVLQLAMFSGIQIYWRFKKRADSVMIPSTMVAVHINLALFAAIFSVGGVAWTPFWGAYLLYIAMIINAFSFQPYLLIPIAAAGIFPAIYHTVWHPCSAEFWMACLVFTAVSLILYGMIGNTVNLARRQRLADEQSALNQQLAGEKYRLSREIHDGIGSSLSDVHMLIDLAAKSNGAVQEARLKEAQEALTEGVSGLRELMGVLEEKECRFPDITENLQKKIRRFDETGFKVTYSSRADDPALPIPAPIVLHILRIAQEGLSNVQKHAGATDVELLLTLRNNRLGFVLADNGRGFNAPSALTDGHGLRNMRERCEELGGTFALDAQPGRGTRIEIGFPIEPQASAS